MENQPTNQPNNKIYRLHWIDYLALIPFLLIDLIFIIYFVDNLINSSFSAFAFIVSVLLTSLVVIGVLNRFVYKVYVDNDGVWISGGIFPWSKGTYGLNWRDISDAIFYTSFISWLFKSYRVIVQHRYTKSSELVIKNIKNGEQLVKEINQKIKELNLY